LSAKAIPLGSEPLSTSDGLPGKLWLVVTVKVPAVPPVNVALPELVIAGASLTVSVKFWVASPPAPLCATIVME
jgi:hypothetical protein